MQIKEKMLEKDGDRQELVMTVVASPEEVDEASKAFFSEIAKRDLKGFRKGKAPKAVLEQSVGGHLNAMGGVAEQLINTMAFKAIDDEDVIFIEEPQFNVDATLEEGKPFSFQVSGPIAPVMDLTDNGPVSITMPPEHATEEEIESQLRELQDYYHSFEDITDEDHTAEMGDYVSAKMTVTEQESGKVVSGLRSTTRLIGLGEGTMPESFDEQLIGHKVGDTVEFDFEAKKDDGTSDYGDGNLHAVVDILGFRTCVLPELDDDFAVKVGCTDVADMHKQMEYNINMEKMRELPKVKVDRSIDQLIKRLDGEVPRYYVDFIRQDVAREFMQNLEQQGTNLQQWMLENSVNGDEMKDDIFVEAKRRAEIDCALEALFRANDLELTDEDIDKLFEGDEEGAHTREAWENANRMADVRKMARQRKATEWLTDNAIVEVIEDGMLSGLPEN